MLSQFVTAAKGLFTRSESQESQDIPTDTAGASAANTSKMVTTRQTSSKSTPEKQSSNGAVKQGKRKAPSDEQGIKRRKRNSLEAEDSDSEAAASKTTTEDKKSTNTAPKAHFRFGSEEPAVPEPQPEEIPGTNQEEDSDSDSDDDAPEAINNSAQLLKIKEQAKKQEQLKQIEEQQRRDKRRKLDERRKLQAKSKAKEPAHSDDLLSESTATLQGSNTQDARRSALPALLPDDILNAEPVIRPPTPPAEDNIVQKKPTKLRFLEKTEKAPKDVQAGDVTIRVLDAPSVKKKTKTVLAPRASKAGKNVKDNWLKRERSTGRVNGLRRTAGGASGFVRR